MIVVLVEFVGIGSETPIPSPLHARFMNSVCIGIVISDQAMICIIAGRMIMAADGF
jgi:hypothetical protein